MARRHWECLAAACCVRSRKRHWLGVQCSLGLYVEQTSPIFSAEMTDPVLMYTTPICPYCVRAKRLLSSKGVSFREIDVSGDPDTRKYLVEVTGQRTVPQIFIGGKSIGGCDDMVALDRQGLLDDLLQQAFAGAGG
jgi:glutaredoxin 3